LYATIEGTNENSTFKEGEAAFYILKLWWKKYEKEIKKKPFFLEIKSFLINKYK